MGIFIIFMLVVLLWINTSLVVTVMGPDWFIELNHGGEAIATVSKALKIIKVMGLVFAAFVTPVMFIAGSIAAALLYFGAFRELVTKARIEYEVAMAEIKEDEAPAPAK